MPSFWFCFRKLFKESTLWLISSRNLASMSLARRRFLSCFTASTTDGSTQARMLPVFFFFFNIFQLWDHCNWLIAVVVSLPNFAFIILIPLFFCIMLYAKLIKLNKLRSLIHSFHFIQLLILLDAEQSPYITFYSFDK